MPRGGSVSDETKPKKFRRMLGVFGRKRKSNQALVSETTAAAAVAAATNEIDADSAYDETSTNGFAVNVEERSVMTAGSARAMLGELDARRKRVAPNTPTSGSLAPYGNGAGPQQSHKEQPYMLKVVLLLMDPRTRRFELLQLEFDSSKALVADVLSQIPISATEDALKDQGYIGICGHDGKQMPQQFLLSQLSKGNEVLVAIPYGQEGANVAKYARPILNDSQVVSMLVSSGIVVDSWREKKRTKSSNSRSSSSSSTDCKNRVSTAETTSEKPPSYVTPQKMAPEAAPPVVKPSEKEVVATTPTKTTTVAARNRVTPKSAANKVETPSKNMVIVAITVVVIAVVMQTIHRFISAPIQPNHVVAPGVWLSKCGLMAFMPTCRNEYLTMDGKGNLSLYDSKSELAWQIQGRACAPGNYGCIPGMQVKEDGSLLVGGKHVTHVTMYKESQLTPWPFAKLPDIKTVSPTGSMKPYPGTEKRI